MTLTREDAKKYRRQAAEGRETVGQKLCFAKPLSWPARKMTADKDTRVQKTKRSFPRGTVIVVNTQVRT